MIFECQYFVSCLAYSSMLEHDNNIVRDVCYLKYLMLCLTICLTFSYAHGTVGYEVAVLVMSLCA